MLEAVKSFFGRVFSSGRTSCELTLDQKRKNRKFYLTVFFFPVAILELVYLTFEVFPFGNNSLLVLDLNAQYIYYYEYLRDVVWHGQSFIYNWSRTLGGENFGLFAYYTASPFMLIFILMPKVLITEALLLTALLKTGCAALTFAWYIKKKYGDGGPRIVVFSTFYALMAYMVIHQMDPMWLDAVIALPLLMYGLEQMVKNGRYKLYTVVLTATFISNFYIGYMVAIFVTVYFFYAYFTTCEFGPGCAKDFAKRFFQFGFFSVLSALMACIVLLPTYFSLTLGKTEFSDPSFKLNSKFDLFDMLPKFLFGAYDTCRPEGLPTLYMGTMALIMLPLFYANKRISVRKKALSAVVLLVLTLSMTMSTVDLVWHGFQAPNWLNYRYSFMLCGFALVLCAESFLKPDGYTPGSVAGVTGIWVLLIFLLEKFGVDYIDVRITVWGSLGLFVFYFAFIAADCKRRLKGGFMIALAFLIGVELYLNGLITVTSVDKDVVYSNRVGYRTFVDTTYPAAVRLEKMDDGFYRTEKTYTRCVNDPMAFRFKGISHSSSTLNRDAIAYVQSLGYCANSHWTKYIAPVLTTDSLIGIKYIFQKTEVNYGMDLLFKEGDIYVYQNPAALPVFYPVAEEYFTFEYEGDNPFEKENARLSAMLGYDEVVEFYKPLSKPECLPENIESRRYGEGYTKYYPEDNGLNCQLQFFVPGAGENPIYAAFPSAYPRKVNIWINKEWYNTYQDGSAGDIIPLGSAAEGETVSLIMTIVSNEVFLKDQLFYYLDLDLFRSELANVAERVSEIENTKRDRQLSATVTLSAGERMYASIPYEQGWNVTVDGKKVETYKNEFGLLGFDIPEGTHELTLRFWPGYYTVSIIISLTALALFIAIVLIDRYCRKTGYRIPSLRELLGEKKENTDQVLEASVTDGGEAKKVENDAD